MIGLDTTAIIDILNDDNALKKVFGDLTEPIVTNRISYLEIMFGIDSKSGKFSEENQLYDNLFDSMDLFELDVESCKKATEIFWKLRKEGANIEQFDCAIAGIYLSNNISKIITKNKHHFEKIRETEVISY